MIQSDEHKSMKTLCDMNSQAYVHKLIELAESEAGKGTSKGSITIERMVQFWC